MVREIEKRGSLTWLSRPPRLVIHVFLRHKMECNIFRYRTWYAVVAGRTGSVCEFTFAFTEKYILRGDSSRIYINSSMF